MSVDVTKSLEAKMSTSVAIIKDELILPHEDGVEQELGELVNAIEDPILIFSEDNLNQLQRRTEELKTERTMQKNKFN